MKKTMSTVTVEAAESTVLIIQPDPTGDRDAIVEIMPEQVDFLVEWLQEARKEFGRKRRRNEAEGKEPSQPTTRSNFNSQPSDLFMETLKQLQALLEMEGIEGVERCFAETVAQERRAATLAGGLTSSEDLADVRAVIGAMGSLERIPGGDHVSAVMKDGRPMSAILQPYGLAWSDLRELVRFCEERALQAHVCAPDSWHFPSVTLLVEVTREDVGEAIRHRY